ncbi:MAG: tetratricopeptide repeat protein [Acidobacteriota bacterium]
MIKATRRTATVCLGVLTLGTVLASAGYEEGLEAFRGKDYPRAIEEFTLEVEKDPSYGYGHFMLGMSYLKLKKHDQALASLKRAAELDKRKLVYFANLAQVYRELGQWNNVVKTLEGKTELRARPNENSQAHLLLGMGYLQVKQYANAVQQLEAANKLTANKVRILSPLGIAYYLNGQYDEAIRALKAALKRKPDGIAMNRYLGESYIAKALRTSDKKQKKTLYASAVQYAEEALSLDGSSDFNTVNLVARSYLGADRFSQAVEKFEEAITLKPRHAYAYYNKGEAHKGLKDWQNAEQAYLKAFELDAKNKGILVALAYTYEQLAKQDEGVSLDSAKKYYQMAHQLKPSTRTRDAIARVGENIRIREENRAIGAENERIAQENLRREEEYAKELEKTRQYEEARRKYMEDKGLIDKERREGTSESTAGAEEESSSESGSEGGR